MTPQHAAVSALLREGPKVANLGIRSFADSVAAQDVPVVHVEWRPPAPLEEDLAELLEELE